MHMTDNRNDEAWGGGMKGMQVGVRTIKFAYILLPFSETQDTFLMITSLLL